MTPLHLGDLHPFEQALTLALAFGPFVVFGIVIAVRRRLDAAGPGDPTLDGGESVTESGAETVTKSPPWRARGGPQRER
ncbi:MAG: hypothetical protein WKF79_05515 [Nocardioides sp.]